MKLNIIKQELETKEKKSLTERYERIRDILIIKTGSDAYLPRGFDKLPVQKQIQLLWGALLISNPNEYKKYVGLLSMKRFGDINPIEVKMISEGLI